MPSLKIRISSIIIRLESSLSSDSSSNCGKIARNPFNARISQRKERQTDQRPMIVRPGSQWDAGNSAIGRQVKWLDPVIKAETKCQRQSSGGSLPLPVYSPFSSATGWLRI